MAQQHRDFQDVLTDLGEGRVHEQAGAELRKVVAAVMETGKRGSVVIRIDVLREGRKAIVKGGVKATVPLAPPDASIFFATEDGELRRDDPKQPALKGVPMKPPVPIRQPDATPATTEKE